MSKKRRKKRYRRPNLPPDVVKPATTDKVNGLLPTNRDRQDFNPDYTYVIKDLKRIGVLAGSFISLLIILSFFLR